MNTNDLVLISILNNRELMLSKIVEEFRQLNLDKLPARTAIYSRLHILSKRNLIKTSWDEGRKLYRASEKGKEVINNFQQTLAKFN